MSSVIVFPKWIGAEQWKISVTMMNSIGGPYIVRYSNYSPGGANDRTYETLRFTKYGTTVLYVNTVMPWFASSFKYRLALLQDTATLTGTYTFQVSLGFLASGASLDWATVSSLSYNLTFGASKSLIYTPMSVIIRPSDNSITKANVAAGSGLLGVRIACTAFGDADQFDLLGMEIY